MKALALLTTVLFSASAFGATLVLQPGPAKGEDAMVYKNDPTRNYGTYEYLMYNYGTGRTVRALVEFTGLSAIPRGSRIDSARLQLYNRANNPNDYFGIYRLTRSWGESTANWNNQPTYYATSYAKAKVFQIGFVWWDMKKLVQEWVSGTYPNYGFILKRDNEGGGSWPHLASSDYGTANSRPKLIVDYSPTGFAPSSIGSVKALFN